MTKIPDDLFDALAHAAVPGLRRMAEEFGSVTEGIASLRLTKTIIVDGMPARVRVIVELDPDEDD